jgi:hypothetical protein
MIALRTGLLTEWRSMHARLHAVWIPGTTWVFRYFLYDPFDSNEYKNRRLQPRSTKSKTAISTERHVVCVEHVILPWY